ncbi:hypothetical protein BRW65_00900 [Mycobacterium paraffinicum]|uniref:DUF4386 domain-containing protein n=1 Tax=Mycobacterium paraffinicum TaxID=53378 RepID=A0A1Q4I240_9MYCO|nr:hypothetical protein [Mycobacterium paraffinicum]OJZ76042.1 hypothetical protein BRW65_00900 [Mycobacterium paraffinicum]
MNRICIWSGPLGTAIVYVGLLIAGLAVAPSPNAPVEFYTDNRHAIQVGMVIAMFGGALYGPWLAMLARAFKMADQGRSGIANFQIVFGVFLMFATLVPFYLLEVAVFRPGAPRGIVQAFVDAAWIMVLGFVYVHVSGVLLTGVYILRERRAAPMFPRWLGWLNVVVALLSLPGLFAGTATTGVLTWNGVVAFGLPSVAFFPWLAAWTYVLLRIERLAPESGRWPSALA